MIINTGAAFLLRTYAQQSTCVRVAALLGVTFSNASTRLTPALKKVIR